MYKSNTRNYNFGGFVKQVLVELEAKVSSQRNGGNISTFFLTLELISF